MSPNNIMAGPPALVYAGFEGGASLSQVNLEKARSKYLVDKLTGKFPDPKRAEALDSTDSKLESAPKHKITDEDVDKGQK